MSGRRGTPEQRFWAKVQRHDGGCWIWTGSLNGGHEPQFRVSTGRVTSAYRYAWEMTHGSEPEGPVFRTCGNLRCVHPDHLAVGHHPGGLPESIPEETRLEMRAWRAAGVSYGKIADMYGFGEMLVWATLNRAQARAKNNTIGMRPPQRLRVTADLLARARELRAQGLKWREIAAITGRSENTLSQMIQKERRDLQ